jgi:hypothetical protein
MKFDLGITALDSGWGNGFGYHKGTEGHRGFVRGAYLRFEDRKRKRDGLFLGAMGFEEG